MAEPSTEQSYSEGVYQVRMRLQDSQDPANRQEVVNRRTPAGLQHMGESQPGSRCSDYLTRHLQTGETVKAYCKNSPHGLEAAARRAESRQRPDTEADGDRRTSVMKNTFKNTITEVKWRGAHLAVRQRSLGLCL